MDASTPRLRMFAGPNGSGKSTIRDVVPESIRGAYINPDDIASALQSTEGQDFDDFGIHFNTSEFIAFVEASEFLRSAGTPDLARLLSQKGNALTYPSNDRIGYLASALSDYLRRKLMEERRWFAFETVMSSWDKVDLLRRAQIEGYRTYLYYIATDDVRVNVERVALRVAQGGHHVPEDKIRARYLRSLEYLADAVHYSNRAYLFDNSDDENEPLWIAEITDGKELELRTWSVPSWVERYVIAPMTGGQA